MAYPFLETKTLSWQPQKTLIRKKLPELIELCSHYTVTAAWLSLLLSSLGFFFTSKEKQLIHYFLRILHFQNKVRKNREHLKSQAVIVNSVS